VHLQITSLLGVDLNIETVNTWKYPCENCQTTFEESLIVSDHVDHSHQSHEKFLEMDVSGFWAAVICHLPNTGRWPRISGIFFEGEAKGKSTLIPLDRDTADRLWRTSEVMLSD
jgi:hypothetical protein